ncbi:hypothetical protein Leucomu_05690 [Leucobacter muris]|uniref:Rho termination factor N-terminal domain-containing protein n=1 Tax=Leucobacter muris TaxID=1935379 RepID=A0ABX5QEK2_9MICO|nr:hypothetical protein [Leucobacter muris]QAB17480.1 hypothetical protein Leucomu_05690 [Leucobacter muris]
MIRLRNTANGAVVKVSEEKAERLRRAGWAPADTTAKPASKPKSEAKPKTEEKAPVEAKPKTEEKTAGDDSAVPSLDWKAAELRDYAEKRGVALGTARTKDEVLAAITAAAPPATADPEDESEGDGTEGEGEPVTE